MRGVEQRSSCGSTRTARGHGQREREQPAVCGARIVAPALPRSDALNYHLISDLRSAHQAALDELFSQMLAVALWPALAYNLTRALTMGWLWAQCATHGAGCPPAAGQNAAPPDPQTHSLSRSERAKLIHSQAASAAKHDRENQSVYAIGSTSNPCEPCPRTPQGGTRDRDVSARAQKLLGWFKGPGLTATLQHFRDHLT